MKFNPKKLLISRRENGLTQEDLARAVGVSRNTIILWENGRSEPDAYNLIRIEKALNKPQAELFDEEYSSVRETREQYGCGDVDIRSIKPLTSDNVITLPILASIPAGLPEYDDKDVESFAQIPRYLFPGADFIIHCCGSSMEPDIHKDDYCVVRKETVPINGKIMLVKTEDGFTIKRVVKNGNSVELHAQNGGTKIIRPKQLLIIGAVIGYWRKMD